MPPLLLESDFQSYQLVSCPPLLAFIESITISWEFGITLYYGGATVEYFKVIFNSFGLGRQVFSKSCSMVSLTPSVRLWCSHVSWNCIVMLQGGESQTLSQQTLARKNSSVMVPFPRPRYASRLQQLSAMKFGMLQKLWIMSLCGHKMSPKGAVVWCVQLANRAPIKFSRKAFGSEHIKQSDLYLSQIGKYDDNLFGGNASIGLHL